MDKETFERLKQIVKDGVIIRDLGGITYRTVQSDKLGFDWKETVINDAVVKQEYVEQTNPVGVESNPIEYYDGVPLINNAFYMKDGVRQVYMDGQWVEF